MVGPHNIAMTQLAQVGLAEKVAQELQSHPEVVGQAARQTTPEVLRIQQAAVPGTEDSKKSSGLKTSDRQPKDQRRHHKKQQRNARPADSETPDSASIPGAWAGYILNVKV